MIGLDPRAWTLWCAYRKEIRKPYKTEFAIERAQKKLASFGQWQMEVVDFCREHEWIGMDPEWEGLKRFVEGLKRSEGKKTSERIEWQNLAERASRVGFRQPTPMDDLGGYRTLVERAEANQPRSSNVVSIGSLLRRVT